MIRTVLGDIGPHALGHAQCHEHIFLEKGASYKVNPALCMDEFTLSLQELASYRAAGGTTIVDAQPVFAGRMARALMDASREAHVHIVAVTGFHKLLFYEPDSAIHTLSEKALTELFISEVTEGMLDMDGARLDGRAGMVKLAHDASPLYAKRYPALYHAAAAAAKETGAPILVHTDENVNAFSILRFLEGYAIPARRVILCHLDRTRHDAGYHKEVLATGAYLCYDSVHRLKYVSDEEERALILNMAQAGYTGQLLLSMDTTRERLKSYGGQTGLDYILTEFIPMLRSTGLPDEAIARMTRENAKEALFLHG